MKISTCKTHQQMVYVTYVTACPVLEVLPSMQLDSAICELSHGVRRTNWGREILSVKKHHPFKKKPPVKNRDLDVKRQHLDVNLP